MPRDYDYRRSNPHHRTNGDDDNDHRRRPRGTRTPSAPSPRQRSRSPPPAATTAPHMDERARREAERRAEMERLRMENEEEERRLAVLDHHKGGGDHDTTAAAAGKPQEEIIKINEEDLSGLDEEEQMRRLLGIEGFGSTKGTKVESNHNSLASGAASKHQKRRYRQYMNRKGGFNRPLDKME